MCVYSELCFRDDRVNGTTVSWTVYAAKWIISCKWWQKQKESDWNLNCIIKGWIPKTRPSRLDPPFDQKTRCSSPTAAFSLCLCWVRVSHPRRLFFAESERAAGPSATFPDQRGLTIKERKHTSSSSSTLSISCRWAPAAHLFAGEVCNTHQAAERVAVNAFQSFN